MLYSKELEQLLGRVMFVVRVQLAQENRIEQYVMDIISK